jgi:tRNA nucleotidyltransferase (CCA-adding enzyme)
MTTRGKKTLRETRHAVSWYELLYLDTKLHLWVVYFLALTARMKTKHVAEMCKKLEIPERFNQIIISERVAANRAVRLFDRADNLRPSLIYMALKDLRHEGLLFAMASCRNKNGQMAISTFVTKLCHVTNHLQGDDLINLGYRPGPQFQTILHRLLMATLDNVCAGSEDEIALLKKEFPLPAKSR